MILRALDLLFRNGRLKQLDGFPLPICDADFGNLPIVPFTPISYESKSRLKFSLDNRAVSYAGRDVLDSDLIGIGLNT